MSVMTIKELEDILQQLKLHPNITDDTQIFTYDSYNDLFPLNLYDIKVVLVNSDYIITAKMDD